MLLSLALLTNLAIACAPQVAPATLAAMAQTESNFETLAIHDNTAQQSYRPREKGDAVELARQLLAEDHDLDLGLMQINVGNFTWLGLTLEDAFDPCHSLAAAATWLTAVSRYNTGSPRAGFANGYVARVVAASSEMNSPRAQHSADPRGGDHPPGSGAKQFNPHEWHDLDSEVDQQGESSGN